MSRIVKGSAIFDMDKLRWFNAQHIRALSSDDWVALVTAQLTSGENPLLPIHEATSPHMASLACTFAAAMKDKVEVLTDISTMVADILKYDLEGALQAPDAAALASNPDFAKLAAALVRDYEAGVLPGGDADAPNFGLQWKEYVACLGMGMGLKGKALFHPLRLLLTGEMSGADVGAQIQLVHFASELGAPVVTLGDRIKHVKDCNLKLHCRS
jgi:glutamyl-tRNA synthetase